MPSPAEAAPAYLWLPELPPPGAELLLDREDAHYVTRVCRAAPGESLTATDGRGGLARLTLLSVRGEARARVASRETAPEPEFTAVACGAPEGQRADWLFEKLGELGVREVQPLDTERASWEQFERRRERWTRLAISALRQSMSAWLLEIRPPLSLEDWLPRVGSGYSRWLADVDGDAAGERLGVAGPAVAMVGPSEGLADSERRRILGEGFSAIRLAAGRLRTETAAVAWAALRAARRPGSGGLGSDSTNP
jgi:16S rRNA (uracil1498-N3)-methyltransferase